MKSSGTVRATSLNGSAVRLMLRAWYLVCALTACESAFATLCAQNRADLVDQARRQVGAEARVSLLGQAVDPNSGPVDATWADGIHELAQTLITEGDPELAAVWLRWAAWLMPGAPVDTLAILPVVVRANAEAQSSVSSRVGPDDPISEANWIWPTELPMSGGGALQVGETASGPVRVLVQGQSVVSGNRLDLPAGTYDFIASAEGFEDAVVTREILPGVTTVLGFNLIPALSDDVQAAVRSKLVRINAVRGGQVFCRTGFIASDFGLVLTSADAVRGAEDVTITTVIGDRTFANVTVEQESTDEMAVLSLDAQQPAGFASASGLSDGQSAWSLHLPTCEAPTRLGHTQIARANVPAAGRLRLVTQVPDAARGGPLVDANGALMGLILDGTSAAPSARALAMVEQARVRLEEERDQMVPSGGVPWGWIGAGAGAVIGAVVVLSGGGNGNGPPLPTTGGIIITFSNVLAGTSGGLR